MKTKLTFVTINNPFTIATGNSCLRLMRVIFCQIAIMLLGLNPTFGQQFNVIGSSFQDSLNDVPDSCFTITQDINSAGGAAWNDTPVSLAYAFDLKFNMFLGYYSPTYPDTVGTCGIGADGICFVLQNTNTGYYGGGGGLGYQYIPNQSLAVEFDTYKNSFDPPYSHIAIEYDGQIAHPVGTLAGPVQMSSTEYYTMDGKWHTAEIKWDPELDSMAVYFDDSFRVGRNFDSLGGLFEGIFEAKDTSIYWGFTGSTGSLCNTAIVCMNSIETINGINKLTPNAPTLQIQPNPSSGRVTVTLPLNGNYYPTDIYNMVGQKVAETVLNNGQNTIDLSNQAAGMYFISVKTEAGIKKGKVVIE